MAEERLPHGYTNATSVHRGVVIKRYLGPDAAARQHAEVTALRHLAGLFPVPALVHHEAGLIGTERVAGTPGQELLETAPEAVLHGVGGVAALLHSLDTTTLTGLGDAPPGAVLVHGDFGPQNLLVDGVSLEVTAVVDWEFAHLGDGVADLAWAEWIVRTHHPHLTAALPSLYEGYGRRPPWPRRHDAMIAMCQWALRFTGRRTPVDESARTMWRERLDATRRFLE